MHLEPQPPADDNQDAGPGLAIMRGPIPFIRALDKKMGMALAIRSYFRKTDNALWGNVADRMAAGNTGLVPSAWPDYEPMRNSTAKGITLMSGRHLQHGDDTQSSRNLEIFSNCSTSSTSHGLFYLLLNGSGVGRDYSEPMVVVDWDNSPEVINVCRADHPDFDSALFSTPEEAQLQLGLQGKAFTWFEVPDSREGWARASEEYEVMAFEGTHKSEILVLDWSVVREKNQPIGGMQDRPSSGPAPTALAFQKVRDNVVGKGLPRWQQAMMVDHYLAECVLVGGARRSARMATMNALDPHAKAFATFKQDHKDEYGFPIFFSSNNSLVCQKAYYTQAFEVGTWANEVFEAAANTAYHAGTGEPGNINVDNFAPDAINLDDYADGRFASAPKFPVHERTVALWKALVEGVRRMPYTHITNPCGEIQLFLLGGYCVIADIAMVNGDTLEEIEEAFRIATRALIRTNTMPSLYDREVKRSNRIGVGPTGIFSFAIKFFGISFFDMLDEFGKGRDFWLAMARFARAVKSEARSYSGKLVVNCPVTDTTIKPAGSTSKLFALEEGAHVPAYVFYLRWMQFRSDDPKVDHYEALGYPVRRELKTYAGTSIVGFPTQLAIAQLGRPDLIVTAGQINPEQHYKYLQLLEKYYIRGVEEDGVTPLPDTGNQVSYTLKYRPDLVSYEQFKAMLVTYQSTVRCCSVMPQEEGSVYEYQPEEAISRGRFVHIVENLLDKEAAEEFDLAALQCASGACPL